MLVKQWIRRQKVTIVVIAGETHMARTAHEVELDHLRVMMQDRMTHIATASNATAIVVLAAAG